MSKTQNTKVKTHTSPVSNTEHKTSVYKTQCHILASVGFRYTYCVLCADVLSSVFINCDFCVLTFEFHVLSLPFCVLCYMF